MSADRLLTAEQVAERLSVSERYVWRLGREGELPRVQVGKYVRFDPADITAFIAGRKEQGRVGSPRIESASPPAVASAKRPSARPRRRFR